MSENKTLKNNMSIAINIIGQEKCTGCFGCANFCPSCAIKMELSEEGFYIPKVDKNKCTDCGLCAKKCPVISFNSDNFSKEHLLVYAGFSNNDEIRLKSSSGGIFSEIAEHLLEKEYVIYGAAWTKNFKIEHIGIKEAKDLYKLRGSKYIQSSIGTVYSEISNLIKEGKKVLFSGTPCQVAAIKMLVKNENLITIDVICHGIPSRIVFDEYLKYIGENKDILNYTFRDKSLGWSNRLVKAQIENGSTYECIANEDGFFHGFICDLYLNMACYECKFSTVPRTGDITLGDFWKISDDLMDERGISVVIGNNEKGIELLQELQKLDEIKLYPKTLESALKGNPRIVNGHLDKRIKRGEILNKVKYKGFEYIKENYISKTERYVPDVIE